MGDLVERVDELGVTAEIGVDLEARDANVDGVFRAGGGGVAVDEADLGDAFESSLAASPRDVSNAPRSSPYCGWCSTPML